MNTPYASASLYVGDLANDVTEGLLFELFNCVGPVASIRVCRDAVTRRSLGYAYVNFHNVVDAERALDTMNNSLIKGRPCRIMWSQRDPSLRKSGVGNIFIKNLDKSIDHKALYDTFSAFGNILSCKVETDENNVSKGYGFVHYETQESADKAIAKVNNMMLNNKKVYVGPFKPRKERVASGEGELKYTNVYVKNLAETVSEETLRRAFEQFGPITNLIIMREEGKTKGFGFVNYSNPQDARKAVEAMNDQVFEGKQIYCGRAQKKTEREAELRSRFEHLKQERQNKYQGVNLYIKNLDDTVDDDKLRAEFASYGSITSAKVMKDDKGGSRGFGFVCFSSPEEATRAVVEMNTKMLGTKPLYVALAQPKEVRKAQLEAQHAGRGKPPIKGIPPSPHLYQNQPPVFYQQQGPLPGAGLPGGVPAGGPFVGYPSQQMMRGRWTGPPQYQVSGYVVPMGQRSQHQNRQRPMNHQGGIKDSGRVGGGGANQNRRGNNINNVPNNMRPRGPQDQGPAGVQVVPTQEQVPEAQPQTPQYSTEQQVLGEKLYNLISKVQPSLAGKITGMILDSSSVEEMFALLEAPDQLNNKITEALEVLEQHSLQI
jgi:polyadenylate-binding protein